MSKGRYGEYGGQYISETLMHELLYLEEQYNYYMNNPDFIDELNDVFCYSIYSSRENYIVKLKVDYIKHNTTVAFPSILFVKDKITEIPYKITSKNNPDVVKGVLNISTAEEVQN